MGGSIRQITLAFAILFPGYLLAQQGRPLPPIDSGTTVRLQLLAGPRISGILIAPFAPDSALFRYCSYPAPPCHVGGQRYMEQSAGNVVAVEVRTGTKAMPGLAIGGIVGVVVGVLGVNFAESQRESSFSTSETVGSIGLSTLIFAGLGLMIGGGMDKWSRSGTGAP